jgi:hypothetical protein
MTGRVRRLRGLAEAAALAAREVEAMACALCGRDLGRRVEWHHRVPRSEGGTETLPLHPICHRTIHACATNRELATTLADLKTLRAQPDIARFLRWIADKPPDFHAPTRRSRS